MDIHYIGLRITGMKPADIRAGELAKIISSFEDMIASTVTRSRPQITKEDLGVGLVNIDDKSIGLEFATKLPELAFPAYTAITTSIAKGKFLDLSSETLSHLREIHGFIKAKNCEGEMFIRNGSIGLKAVLLPSTEIPEHPVITSRSTLYGRIVRVGGSKPRVMFETPTGETLFCSVKNESLARRLGERLYTWVGLKGIATLDSDNSEIVDFRVEDITDYEGTIPLSEAILELSALVGKYYTDVANVEQYIEDLRS